MRKKKRTKLRQMKYTQEMHNAMQCRLERLENYYPKYRQDDFGLLVARICALETSNFKAPSAQTYHELLNQALALYTRRLAECERLLKIMDNKKRKRQKPKRK